MKTTGIQLKYIIDRAIEAEIVEHIEEVDRVLDWLEENYRNQYDVEEATEIFNRVITKTYYKNLPL